MRTVSQRMHDAVRDAAKLMLGSGDLPSQAGVPTTLLITLKLDDLERRTGHVSTAHGGLLPIRDVLRMAANARLVPVVFDTDGEPLWLGQATSASRPNPNGYCSPLIDKGCVYPGCDVPATRCEVMHLHDWVKADPPTSTTSRSAATTTTTASANGHCNAATGGCGAPHRCGSTPPTTENQHGIPRPRHIHATRLMTIQRPFSG